MALITTTGIVQRVVYFQVGTTLGACVWVAQFPNTTEYLFVFKQATDPPSEVTFAFDMIGALAAAANGRLGVAAKHDSASGLIQQIAISGSEYYGP